MTTGDIEAPGEATFVDPVAKSTRNIPPYRLYALIILSFIAIRFGDLLTQHMDWTVWVYNSRLCRFGLPLAAIFFSYLTVMYLKGRVPNSMIVLLCGFVGGTITLLTNSAIGMMIGFLVGGVLVWGKDSGAGTSQITPFGAALLGGIAGWIPILARSMLPAVTAGGTTGALLLVIYVNFGQASRLAELFTLFGTLLTGLAVFVLTLRQTKPGRRWYGWLGVSCLFLCAVVLGLLVTSACDSHRRCAAMPNVRSDSHGIEALQTLGGTQLQRAIAEYADACLRYFHIDALSFGPHSSDADIAYARGLPAVLYLTFERGCLVTDASIEKLCCRYLVSFRCGSGTKLTDEGVRRLEKSGLTSLELEGPNFTDASLEGLTNIPKMMYLTLCDTKVTSAGLRKLDPKAPLWYLDLRNTKVDDDVLLLASRLRSLQYLHLRGTNVTGSGLKHLRGRSIQLNLANTPFEERYLADLLPSKKNQPTIASLSLRGIPLSPEALTTVSKFQTLTSLDVTGSTVSTKVLALIGKLPNLGTLAIDGDQLTAENIKTLRSRPELHLTYNTAEKSLGEIQDHLAILADVPESGMQMANAQLTIENLKLNNETVRELRKMNDDAYRGITLEKAIKPDGTRQDYSHVFELHADFTQAFKSR